MNATGAVSKHDERNALVGPAVTAVAVEQQSATLRVRGRLALQTGTARGKGRQHTTTARSYDMGVPMGMVEFTRTVSSTMMNNAFSISSNDACNRTCISNNR